MNAKDFLKQHLGCADIPDTIPADTVIEAIGAAQQAATDETSDFDEERIQNLRNALKTIEENSKDLVACMAAKRALLNDDQYTDE